MNEGSAKKTDTILARLYGSSSVVTVLSGRYQSLSMQVFTALYEFEFHTTLIREVLSCRGRRVLSLSAETTTRYNKLHAMWPWSA